MFDTNLSYTPSVVEMSIDRTSLVREMEMEETSPNGEEHLLNQPQNSQQEGSAVRRKPPSYKIFVVFITLVCIGTPILNFIALSFTEEEVKDASKLILSLASQERPPSGDYKNNSQEIEKITYLTRPTMRGEEEIDLRLQSPFTAVIAGPTGSGKTELMKRLIEERNNISDQRPDEVIYCYGAWQKGFHDVKNVTFHEGMIDFKNDLPDDGKHRWLIIDDLMSEMSGTDEGENLFAKYSHHKNISVFFIIQNFFRKGNRSMTLNSHYIFLFKNPRDASQISFLARQLFPENSKFLIESYKDATKKPHSYLMLDLKQNTDEDMRVLGNFLSSSPSEPIAVYTPK